MPDVNVRGRYRAFTYDGTTPLDFTTYANNVSVIRRPNEISFVTLRQYIPGFSPPFTTFEPGSSYVVVSRNSDANFDMGPYTRVDRLPPSLNVKSPQYYLGLDKNSITIPLSVYALSVNTPLSSVTGITYVNGVGASQGTVTVNDIRNGFETRFTHFLPNSGYQLRNRVPYTFFAPLQSEMGDAYAIGDNNSGEYGMGYRVNNTSLPGDNIYGIWDKIVSNNYSFNCSDNNQTISAPSLAALSSCGSTKALFVLGNNLYGQLGTGSTKQYYATWTRVSGQWQDVYLGPYHMLAINPAGHLYACGSNSSGQLGLGSGTLSADTLTLVDNTRSYVELAAHSTCTMVRASNGFIYACGRNHTGQLCINNITSPIYTLTQEASGLSWSSLKAQTTNGFFIAISNKKLFGSPGSTNPEFWGGGLNPNYAKYTFAQENLSLSDVLETYISRYGTVIRRENQNKLFAVGYDGGSTRRRLALLSASSTQVYFAESSVPSNATIVAPGDGIFTSINYHYILNGKLYYKATNSNSFLQTDINAFNIFSGINDTPTFILSARNDLRPTPTPTVTPSPTPSPVPSLPYNTLQVGIFGTSFQLNSNTTSTQVVFNNTPGNLSNNFTLETINSGSIPPGATVMTTFDFEKTAAFNNIVGISVIQQYNQNPAGREFCRYLYKKSGSTWTYTLLPSQFDALSKTNPYLSYRTSETGADNLFITPPNPSYPNTSQGIYFLMFIRDETFYEAISYDRGVNWTISPFFGGLGSAQYFGLDQNGMCKIIYSRTRGTDYQVQAVGYANNAVDGTSYQSLYFSKRFPNSTAKETISSISNAWGFDFKHDYFNIPTVVSYAIDRDSPGKPSGDIWGRLLIHRKIGNTWQTDIIKAAISMICIGPYYQVPAGFSVYKRLNSPSISIEFDSTNTDLIYVTYLLSRRDVTGYSNDPMYINVLCYNMKTKSIVFDENVIKARSSVPGSYLITLPTGTTSGGSADIPTLYFDTTDNTLNLFFVSSGSQATASVSYFKTKRLGANNWSPVTNVSTGSVRSFITGSRELKIKY